MQSQQASRLIASVRGTARTTRVVAVSLALLAFAYASLFAVGSQYGFEKTVEYWLFRPTDNAPIAVLVLSGWLLYRRWYRLRALPRSTAPPSWIGVALLSAVVLHGWAVYTRADDLKIFSMMLGASGLVLAWWNVEGVRAVWLPFFFLLFAIPIPAPLLLPVVFQLQIWTAEFAGVLLHVLGIPALVSGDQILRATQTFQVIEGCSGIRSIATLSMLTILLIDLFGRRGWHAALLLLVAPLVAFLLNGVRVVTIILNPHSEVVAIHNVQGIAILITGLVLVYGLDVGIERLAGDHAPGRWTPAGRPERRPFSAPVALGALVTLAVATTASTLFVPAWEDVAPAPRILNEAVDAQLGDWPSEKVERDYAFQGSTRYREILHRDYALEAGPVTVFVATADLGQRGGSLLSPITARPGSGWLMRESGSTEIDGAPHPVDTYVYERGKQRVLVYHWFVGDRGLAVETLRSLMAIDRSPARRAELPYVVRLEATILGHGDDDRADAAARLELANRLLRPVFERLDAIGQTSL